MERKDFGRSRGVQLVGHADEVLGQRENAKIHEGSSEAGDTMAQGAYADRAARVRRRVSPGDHLRAPHRRDEATRRAHRMGEYRQPGGDHVELGRLESEAAPSEYGAAIYRLSAVHARAPRPAHAPA